MASIGFGIVGCGMIAGFHARAIAELRGAKLVAVSTSREENGRRIADLALGCQVYTDYEKFLKHAGLDVVIICTPSGAHLEPAISAAAAGKHVVVEKPLEVTLARCDRIIAACKSAGVLLCTIFPSRFSPANLALKRAINAGRFGRLTLADTYVKWYRTQEYYDSGGWRGTWKLDGGGAFMNQAIHNVDLLQWLAGDVAEIVAFTGTLAHERIEVEDVGVAALKFQNGALGVIEATTAAYPGMLKRTEIHGTHGSAVVEQDSIRTWQFAKPVRSDAALLEQFGSGSQSTGGAGNPAAISHAGHREQLKDFVAAIRKGTAPVVTGDEGRKSVEIILAIYAAAKNGKSVSLLMNKKG